MPKRQFSLAALIASYPLIVFAAGGQGDFLIPEPPAGSGKSLQLWATNYYVHIIESASQGIPFKNGKGEIISDNVTPKEWCLAAIEGTTMVPFNGDMVMLNYAGKGGTSQVDCARSLNIDATKPGKQWILATGKSYFTRARGDYGDGVQGFKLVPYRTIAVDKSLIPYGTALFIPKARGIDVTLPNGERVNHDGYFFAADKGGAIKGNHIDVFCGMVKSCLRSIATGNPAKTFSAVVITDSKVVNMLRKMHSD